MLNFRNTLVSSGKWSNLGQPKTNRKIFYNKKSLISEFLYISRTNPESKFHCPRIFKNLKSDQIVIFYVLNKNFFYTQVVAFAYVPDNTDDFFLFCRK